jgi:hypothetical protein
MENRKRFSKLHTILLDHSFPLGAEPNADGPSETVTWT